MVVEDDALVLEGMSGLLRNWGCHVVPFGSAKAALADVSLWEGSPPNLIIADYSLPEGKSGLELIATLRSAFGGEIAAFLISGDTSPDTHSRGAFQWASPPIQAGDPDGPSRHVGALFEDGRGVNCAGH